MYPLKQSTAITGVFFAHDANGDGVTSLVDGGFTKRISKGSGAFAAMTVTITEMENGWYSYVISTTHSDTLGILTITFTHASCKQVNQQFRVHARLPDDHAFPATSGRSSAIDASGRHLADVDTIKTNPVVNAGTVTFPTTATLASTTNITAGTLTTVTNLTNLPAITANWLTATGIANDAITAAKIANAAIDAATFAADVDAEILSYIVDDLTRIDASALNTASVTTIPAILDDTDDIGIAGAGLTALATQASVNTIDGIVDDILLDTAVIGAAGAGLTALATQASVNTIDGIVDAILVDTTEIGVAGVGLTAVASAANLATVAGYLDTEIADIKTVTDALPDGGALTSLAQATALADIQSDTDDIQLRLPAALTGGKMDSSVSALTAAALDSIWDEVVESGFTVRQLMRAFASALTGKASGLETTTAVYRDIADTKDRITATVDADGNRTAITLDVT